MTDRSRILAKVNTYFYFQKFGEILTAGAIQFQDSPGNLPRDHQAEFHITADLHRPQ